MQLLIKFTALIGLLFLAAVVYANGLHAQRDARCLDCHGSLLIGQTLHFAQRDDDCLLCHGNMDGSSMISTAENNLLCVTCHADHDFHGQSDDHSDLLCIECHDPHSSAQPHLFRLPEASLCARECHGKHDLGMSHPTGVGTIDRTTGGEVTCVSTCHTMHKSEEIKMLQMTSTRLCFRCHGDKF